MTSVDAVTIANLAMRAGLLTSDQVQQGWDEVGNRGGEAEPFLLALERKGHLTPWQSQKLLKQEKDGYFLGGYRILYKIASGSFGRVYRAADPATGRVVAIKILRRKWSEDQHNIELFEREGQVGMTLKHPNIVEILAVNRDPATRQYYIVMEFVEGGNLREILNIRGKLDAIEVLRILDDVASGLNYALSRGITHRDMKLTNVLVSSAGSAKLVDFGLAQLCGGRMQVAKEEVSVDRTVDYAGLERATNVRPGDTRSDIYFLGCIAYELLTGRSPLDMSRSAKSRMAKERFTTIQHIRPEEVTGPPAVLRLVEAMMSLNPSERFQTPTQALDAIREVRREVDSKHKSGQSTGQKSIFLVEKDERLQDLLREKLKENGFRVLIAGDPMRALDRFRQQPFDLLLANVSTVGEDALFVFERILADADKYSVACAGIIVLGADQEAWTDRVKKRPTTQVLMQPVKFKQLLHTIHELLGVPAKEKVKAAPPRATSGAAPE